jgi:long-subunit fatty acid transport protein
LGTFNGNGGTTYAFIGGGYRYKGFSVGANFGYIFGTINHFKEITGIDTFKVNHARFANSTKIGGIYWKAGALYETNFNKKLGMRAGVTFAASQNITARRDEYWYSVSSADPTIFDTARSLTDVKNTTTIPMAYSAGFHMIGIDKWMVGIDFSGASWSDFRNFGARDSVADNAYKISVGGEYTPNMASITRYFDRVTYRVGFSYGQDHVYLRGTNINYYSGTVGMSLPFRRATDRIHMAFEMGSRGTTANGLLRETFTRFSLGISLNDRWFVKRRYD